MQILIQYVWGKVCDSFISNKLQVLFRTKENDKFIILP